jgi:hypothetical protein
MKFSALFDRTEYLLLAAFMIPSVIVLAAAVASVSHADDSAARELLGSSNPCADEHFQ